MMKKIQTPRGGSGAPGRALLAPIGKAIAFALLGSASLHAQDLVHRWSFDDLNDSAGSANVALTGGAALSGGRLTLPGGSPRTNYASVPIGPTLASADSLTVEAWFTVATLQNWSKVWMFGTPGASGAASRYIDFTPRTGITNNPPSTGFNPSGAEVNTRGGENPPALAAGTPYLSTVVFDDPGDEIRLYLNGVLADSVAWNGTISQLGETTQNFIGAAVFYGDSDFAGSVDELRIWKGAMSEAQVAANAAAGPDAIVPHDPRLQTARSFTAASSGEAITIDVPITNLGAEDNLTVSSAAFEGGDTDLFSVETGLPLVVAPGATVNLTIGFDPVGFTGSFPTTLVLGSDDAFKPQERIGITVNVDMPEISVPPVVSYGPVANDAPVQAFDLQILNEGLGVLEIHDAFFIAGPAAPTHFQQFAVTHDFGNDGPLFVAAESGGTLSFTFDPAGLKGPVQSGVLRLVTNDYITGDVDVRIEVGVTFPPGGEETPVLAHRWSFDDTSDSAGSAEVELHGSAAVSGGQLVLSGGGTRVNHASVPIGATIAKASSLTVEAWFTAAAPAQTWRKAWMFGTAGASAAQSTYIDFTPYSGTPEGVPSSSFRSVTGELTTRGDPNPAPLEDRKYHCVTVYDSEADLISIYLDGVLADSVAWTGEVFQLGNTTQNFIGAAVFFGDTDWAGTVDELRVWTGAFTAANAAVSYATGENELPDLDAEPGPDTVTIGSVQVVGGNIVIGGVSGLVAGRRYHLETGVNLDDFAPVAGSTFSAGDPIPQVPAVGPRRFVRIVEGPEP